MKNIAVFAAMLIVMAWAVESRGAIVITDETGQEVGLYEESHALLIGVSKYTGGWPDLPGVREDVVAVKEVLEKHGFQVTLVEDPDYESLNNAFRNFVNKYGRNPGDRLLFYFSGHGHTLEKGYGGNMGYIVPSDAPNPNKDPNGFQAKAVNMQMIEVYARDIDSKHALFLFDSCFSGSLFALTRAIPENIGYKTARPVRQFITAGAANERVPDISIFRRQFVDALNGEGDIDNDGYVTGTELGEFLQKSVINYSKGSQNPQYGKIRDPQLDKGDFVFELRKHRAPKVQPPPPPSSGSFSLEDLQKEAQEVEAVKKAWNARLDEMKKAFEQVEKLEGMDISSDSKATAWERFRETFSEENPYSEEDDTMRASVSKQIAYWQGKVKDDEQAALGARPEKIEPLEIEIPKTRINLIDGSEMMLIPAGEFEMGSKAGYSDEKPVHTVYLDAFYMDRYEVSNVQYKEFMDATGHKAPRYWGDSRYNAPGNPVVGVNWYDAEAYAVWAGKRLPTEAEWEKAARGGLVGKKYPWGDRPSRNAANYTHEGENRWSGTSPVGSFSPNSYGLFDMVGNAFEWCADWYDEDYYLGSPRRNPTGPRTRTARVLRGGSWYDTIDFLRCAKRDFDDPNFRNANIGFRCVQ